MLRRLVLVLGLAAACGREPEVAFDGPRCPEQTTVLAGLDTLTSIGFTGVDVFATVGGAHTAPIAWSTDFGPETGETQLTATIVYEGGEIRHVIPINAGTPGCPAHLDIDVAVTLESDGGALAEQFTATLRAYTPTLAVLGASLPFTELAGSLAPKTLAPGAELGTLDLTLGVGPSGLFGDATTSTHTVMGGGVLVSFLDVARWPASSPCEHLTEAPIAPTDPFQNFSVADALLLPAAAPLALTWQGSPPTALSLALTDPPDFACVTYQGGPLGTIRTLATAVVATGDLRWDGELPVELLAHPNPDGTLHDLEIVPPHDIVLVPTADFAATYGLHDIDFAGFSDAFLQLTGSFTPDGDAAGAVDVLGIKHNPCPPTGGCMGDDIVTLAAATWSSP